MSVICSGVRHIGLLNRRLLQAVLGDRVILVIIKKGRDREAESSDIGL